MRVGGSKFSLSSLIKTIIAFLAMIGAFIFLQNIVFIPRKLEQENEEDKAKESDPKTALRKRRAPVLTSQELNSAGFNPVEEFLVQSYEKRFVTENLESTLIEGTEIGVLNGSFSEVSNIVIKGDYAFYGFSLIDISNGSHPFIVRKYDTIGYPSITVQLSLSEDQNSLLVTNAALCVYNISNVTNPTLVQYPCYQTTSIIFPAQAESVNSRIYLILDDDVLNYVYPDLFDVINLTSPTQSLLGDIQYLSAGRLIDMEGDDDYLYLIDANLGFGIFDSRQPIISQNTIISGAIYNLDVNNNYLCAGANTGFYLFDKLTLEFKGYAGFNTIDVFVVDTTAHLAAGTAGYVILDVKDPSNLQVIGVYADPYVYRVKVFRKF